ncbi:MAG: PhnD/SsuA/transferrin family substrate-binding protein [Helicobacteraceae bacterium]|jgi:ABC-type phosphate/phosphonate transport system substrate-binding protein|nr:PhnD/SsuA/transferrin family substrate-binding protein [Helicobacteraceae bacterium]
MKTLIIGAVAYDPKVTLIWDIIRDYFNDRGVRLDYVLFSNYEFQVEALCNGFIDIAWNTNVAWLQTLNAVGGKAKAIVMRDTDANFTSKLIVKSDSPIKTLSDLNGKTVALGSADSAQAAILPKYYMDQAGVAFKELRFNSDVGKHGDTGKSETDVLQAVRSGKADAGAVGCSRWINMLSNGEFAEGEIEAFWTSPEYCHCNFTILESADPLLAERFSDTLLGMDPNDPTIKKMMAMEGLNRWLKVSPELLKGYDNLSAAMKHYDLYKGF